MSPEFINSVTDAVMAEVGAWQTRPLEPMYPVVFLYALRVKIRKDAVVLIPTLATAQHNIADAMAPHLVGPAGGVSAAGQLR